MDIITTRELKERLAELQGQEVSLQGWIRNHRKQKNMGFIDFFDGTCFKNPRWYTITISRISRRSRASTSAAPCA